MESGWYKRLYYQRWFFNLSLKFWNFVMLLFEPGGYVYSIYQASYIKKFDKHNRQYRKIANGEIEETVDWENPGVVGRSKTIPHSVMKSFRSISKCKDYWKIVRSDDSSFCNKVYLTGIAGQADKDKVWKFRLFGNPKLCPCGWYEINFQTESWDNIALPCHWQCAGYDIPMYTNTVYPFRFDPPRTRRDGTWATTDCDTYTGGSAGDSSGTTYDAIGENVSAIYQHKFSLPEEWSTELDRVFIVFEGVDSCLTLYINGKFVGYSQDSNLPAEFDITDLLADDDFSNDNSHVLTCQVMRWCDGTYLEDQDKWWLSGIFREVYLLRKSGVAMIQDYEVTYKLEWNNAVDAAVTSAAIDVSAIVEGDRDLARSMGYPDLEMVLEVHDTTSTSQSHSQSHSQSRATGAASDEPVLKVTQTLKCFLKSTDDVGRKENISASQFCTVSTANAISDPYEAEVLSQNERFTRQKVSFSTNLLNPILWSAETPHTYVFMLYLQQPGSTADTKVDVEGCRVGLREVRIGGKDNTLQVNRRTITVAGVNRQEFHPKKGRALSTQDMLEEIAIMKQFNFNAVRLSHHCPSKQWVELCELAGLFVICESNIETHGFQCLGQPVGYLSSLREWRGAMMSRTVRMFEYFKNYGSIIGWSLGNESGIGPAHEYMAQWLHARDPSGRFVQYESGGSRTSVTDIICPMYRRPSWCKWYSQNDPNRRPVILCEYAHAMGNSAGGLHDYWKFFRDASYPRLQGGFIWDFIDQGLSLPSNPNVEEDLDMVINGSQKFKYGGDFGDVPNSKQFCINGILGPDKKPHPIAWEAAALQSPVELKIVNVTSGKQDLFLSIKNWRSHATLSDILIQISAGCEKYPTTDGSLTVNIPLIEDNLVAAGEEKYLSLESLWPILMESMLQRDLLNLPCPLFSSESYDAWINVSAVCNAATQFIPLGHKFCHVSLRHPLFSSRMAESLSDKMRVSFPHANICHGVKCEESASQNVIDIKWNNGSSCATVGKKCGRLLSWISKDNMELITSPVDICLWRALTDNDRGGADNSYRCQWLAYGLNNLKRDGDAVVKVTTTPPSSVQHILKESNNSFVAVESHWDLISSDCLLPVRISCTATYVFCENGSILIEFSSKLPSDMPPCPRFGLRMGITQEMQRVQWLGAGPHEAYDDRLACVRMGLFESSVNDLHTPYVFPQECGRRSDPRVINFTHKSCGLNFAINPVRDSVSTSSTPHWGWSASLFSMEALETTAHNYDLTADPNSQVHVHLDRYTMGIGGYDSWSPNVDDAFLISTGKKLSGAVVMTLTA